MESFSDQFKNRSKEIDISLGISNVPLKSNETVPIPKYVEQPTGPLYAIYKRTPAGYNRILFSGLTKKEADYKYEYLNRVEVKKRERAEANAHEKGFEYNPTSAEIVIFDVVEMGTAQESPYWNPKEHTI